MAKTYEGEIVLKEGSGSSIKVRAEGKNPSDAKQVIEAQYAGKIKRWTRQPRPVS